MTRSKTVTVLGSQRQRSRVSLASGSVSAGRSEGSFSNHRPVLRALLYSSVLTGGLVLANATTVAPAYAAACGTAADFANSTQCIGGNDAAGLVYVDDNPLYVGGDFTLLLDTHTVTGAAGENGITFQGVTANDDGTVIVRNTSSVNSGTGADGINSTAANAGTITLISIETSSTVTGANNGIVATATGGGPIEIRTQAGTTVTGNNGAGISGTGTAAGNVTINAQGAVNGTGGANDGISANTVNGTASVTTGAGAINGGDNGIEAIATGTGTALVTTGTGTVTGTTGSGILASGDSATVDAHGNVTGGSAFAGINAEADNGNASVTTAMGTTVTGVTGVIARASGATGDAIVKAESTVTGSTVGILATSTNGTANVTTGAAAVTGNAGNGIDATGNIVIVSAGGNVTGTGGVGINAVADTGTATVTTAVGSTVSGTAGAGINAVAPGDVLVDPDGNVSGSTLGINAVSNTVGNVNVVTLAGTTVSGGNGDGINAETTTAGNTGNVVVNAQSAVNGIGAGAHGIDANAIAGTVNVTTGTASVLGNSNGIDATASGAVTVGAGGNVAGNDIGINAVATNGDVNVTTAAGFAVVGGTGDDGINAEATATGNVVVLANSTVNASAIGIDANAVSGTVQVTTGTAAVTGNAGIDATASGAVTVGANGNVTGTLGTGINAASSNAGAVNVTTAFGRTVDGTTGDGINAATTGAGTVTIANSSTTQGFDTGVEATSATGGIQITNSGFIQNRGLTDDLLAIRTTTTGGATSITNNAFITGRVITSVGGDTLTNNAFWFTEGDSDFGGGNDTVTNNAFLRGADEAGVAETTRLLNLETLSNNGFLDLHDQSAGDGSNISDTLSASGNYAGGGFFDVDAFLGGPGSNADQLIVGGNVSGVTTVLVTDTNAGPGAFNPTGIVVVDVAAGGTTAAGDFVLADGPIDKGLFFYDLLFDSANNNHVLVGLPGQGVFETLAVVSSNQEIWRETANAWSTRQENLRDVLATSYGVTAVADPPVESSTAPMGSLWVSALGSWSERDDDASFSLLNANLEFDLSYNQDIYGVVGGADFATDVGADSRLLFGVMAGYVDSNLDFDDSDTSIDTDGATIGAYAAFMSGGFFATVLVKADLLNMDYSTSEVDGEDSADVTSWGARGDFGYRFGDTFFVEPMISVDGISTDIDEFTIAGADIDAGTNESFRAGAGLRAGYGGEDIRASATARIWDVFSTDNEVEILAGVPLGLSDDDLEGVYGDVSGQIDVSLSTNATIYLKGGVLFSDDVTKPNASGGFALYW